MKSRQRDALEGADDVVGAFLGEEAFVIARAEVPVGTFVIFVAIKSPDAAHHYDATHPIVPEIANVIKAEVGTRVSALESSMIVKDELRQPNDFFRRFDFYFAGTANVIGERSEFPFHVDDAAVVGRKFCFRYLSHKRRRFDVDLEQGLPPCRERLNRGLHGYRGYLKGKIEVPLSSV